MADSAATRPPATAVIVLNWNRWQDTVACVDSLAHLRGSPPMIIVVDNGSQDRSPEHIRRACKDVTVLEMGRNLGFAGGVNAGIKHACASGADQVWLLNNDTVVTPDALAGMTDVLERDATVGIVGSIVRRASDPGDVEAWGGGMVRARLALTRRANRAGAPLDYITGTSMLIRRAVLDQIGLLDEDYFFYLEDVDLSRRAVRAGWRLAVSPRGSVIHAGGATVNAGAPGRSAAADLHHTRSSGVFIGKHAGRWLLPAAVVRAAGIVTRRVLRGELGRVSDLVRAFVAGLIAGARARRRHAHADGAIAAATSATKDSARSVTLGPSA